MSSCILLQASPTPIPKSKSLPGTLISREQVFITFDKEIRFYSEEYGIQLEENKGTDYNLL